MIPFVELKMIVNRGKVRLDTIQQRKFFFILLDTVRQRNFFYILLDTIWQRIFLYFAGHCLVEKFFFIFCWTLSGREFFFYILPDIIWQRIFLIFCWTLSGREFCIEKDRGRLGQGYVTLQYSLSCFTADQFKVECQYCHTSIPASNLTTHEVISP